MRPQLGHQERPLPLQRRQHRPDLRRKVRPAPERVREGRQGAAQGASPPHPLPAAPPGAPAQPGAGLRQAEQVVEPGAEHTAGPEAARRAEHPRR